jgi:hypothetical protein
VHRGIVFLKDRRPLDTIPASLGENRARQQIVDTKNVGKTWFGLSLGNRDTKGQWSGSSRCPLLPGGGVPSRCAAARGVVNVCFRGRREA